MARSFIKLGATSLIILSALTTVSPALARGHYNNGYYNNYNDNYYDNRREYRESRYDREDRYDRGYRGDRCNKGTGGTIIGAIAGGLLGHEIVGRRGDKTAGVIIGAGVGALTGRALDRSSSRNRC